MDVPTILATLGSATAWVLGLRKALHDQKAEADVAHQEAIAALQKAATATRSHLAELREKNEKERSNQSLVDLWLDASRKLRLLNGDLAERTFFKADYWSDPEIWTGQKVAEAKIELDQLIAALMDFSRECCPSGET